MMLNTALHKMIDNCEMFLFLGTPNSVSVKNGIENQKSLKSPWIFSELAFIQHVRRKSKFRHEIKKSVTAGLESAQIIMDSLQVHYDQPKLDYRINSKTLENILRSTTSGNSEMIKALYAQLTKNSPTPVTTNRLFSRS